MAAVVVFLALIGGTLAALGLREQELPNVDLPAASIVVLYSAATPAQMRDTIVKLIEDQLAGAPQLQHLQKYPYCTLLSAQPFNAYVNLEIKL